MAHGLDVCEVNMRIPFNPMEPWSGSVVGSKPDSSIKMMPHVALTSLCESCLATTAMMPIALLPICNQENPIWQQCLKAVSNLRGPHFSTGLAVMSKYVQYLFNLQHNTARTVMQQPMHLTAYEEHSTATSRELEHLRYENAILRIGTLPPSDQDYELKVMYCCLSEAERGWNYARQ
jgi:hypothetical protein